MENSDNQSMDSNWLTLYRAGALSPLVAIAFYLVEFSLLIVGEPYPSGIAGWYALVQRSKLLALWYLNALDILSFVLLGIMFLALYVALRRVRPAWMLIAVYLALLGVAVFIVPRTLHLSLLPLSDLHAAATTDAQRALYLAAGEALSQVSSATPQTLGFLLMAAAGLIISLVVLRSGQQRLPIGTAAAYVGVIGFVAALANYLARLLAPDMAAMIMPVNGLLWFAWWILVSVGLFKLASTISGQEMDSVTG
ncbi:MAG: hypothetical protein ACOYZ7_06170 [Chloroflexota bacterium]